MKREKKKQIIDELKEKLGKSQAIFMTDYTGLTVQEMNDLRRRIKKSGGEYKVVKNTLYRIAVSGTPYEVVKEFTAGPTGVVFCYDDPVSVARVITDFSKDFPNLKIKKGVLEKKVLEEEDIKKLAKLPTRNELIAKVVGAFTMIPLRLVYVLKANLNNLLFVLSAIKAKKEGGS